MLKAAVFVVEAFFFGFTFNLVLFCKNERGRAAYPGCRTIPASLEFPGVHSRGLQPASAEALVAASAAPGFFLVLQFVA